MDRYTLFDAYIAGDMDESQVKGFEESLKKDKDFESDFQLYIATISAICKEEQQDGIDFAHSMKKISKQELYEIIGKKTRTKKISFPYVIASVISVAAVVVIAMTFMFNIIQNNHEDNLIFEFNKLDFVIRGGAAIDYNDVDNLEEVLPEVLKLYKNAENAQEEFNNGKILALIYIKFHERNKARVILQNLIEKYENSEDYSDFTEHLDVILQNISD